MSLIQNSPAESEIQSSRDQKGKQTSDEDTNLKPYYP